MQRFFFFPKILCFSLRTFDVWTNKKISHIFMLSFWNDFQCLSSASPYFKHAPKNATPPYYKKRISSPIYQKFILVFLNYDKGIHIYFFKFSLFFNTCLLISYSIKNKSFLFVFFSKDLHVKKKLKYFGKLNNFPHTHRYELFFSL